MRAEPFLKRVRIQNYKSIAKCDVKLGPLTLLVGRNGSGKSNFLDALRFVLDGLETSLDHAMKSRGGIKAVRRQSTGHPRNFAIGLDMNVSARDVASYMFEITAGRDGGFTVKNEQLKIVKASGELAASYRVEKGKIVGESAEEMPPVSPDRLYLVNAAGLPQFRGVYDALLAMGFYNLNPDAMRKPQSPDVGELLHRDGANIAAVVGRLGDGKSKVMARIRSYLRTVVPEIKDLKRVAYGPLETLEFRQEVVGSAHPWKFAATNMSDGTLRALGSLVAVTQLAGRKGNVRLVGIEEPETALHPAAAGALMDALREAATHTQILVTTHSPDLLDQFDGKSESLLALRSKRGATEIGPVDEASRQTVEDHLFSAGELLRMDQLEPDREDVARQKQMRLFDSVEEVR